MARHNEIGKIGEEITCKWLLGKDFKIIEQNYNKKCGEIDIVARETNGKVHFIEVKTVSYETKRDLLDAVSRKTWRPEENVHTQKQKRLSRTILIWLNERKYSGDWVIDIAAVRLVPREKYGSIEFLQNVIFEF